MKRHAILVGCNYPGTPYALKGCANDVFDIENLAQSQIGRRYETHVITDDDATRGNVLPLLAQLVDQTKYGDRLLVWYSGHGTQIPDRTGDETDAYDEAWCLADFQRVGVTGDDEINAILTKRHYGSRIFVGSDSCFSASVNRFVGDGGTPRFIDGTNLERAAPKTVRRAFAKNPGVLLSGCRDDQVSYDATFNGRANGAMTRVAVDAWAAGATVGAWHTRIRTRLPSRDYPQDPQLSATWAQRRWAAIG